MITWSRRFSWKFFFPALVFFFMLSLSEFFLSRGQLLTQLTRPSPTITLVSTTPISSNQVLFTWAIKSNASGLSSSTAIYWDYQSTPSAVTRQDAPQALGYRFHTSDYLQGQLTTPANFSSTIKFPSSGTIYYRAYAYLNQEHLWTDEYSFKLP